MQNKRGTVTLTYSLKNIFRTHFQLILSNSYYVGSLLLKLSQYNFIYKDISIFIKKQNFLKILIICDESCGFSL